MGPAGTSTFCKKSSLRHCLSLSEKQRKDIFDQFWKMNTWEARRFYVYALVDRVWKQEKSIFRKLKTLIIIEFLIAFKFLFSHRLTSSRRKVEKHPGEKHLCHTNWNLVMEKRSVFPNNSLLLLFVFPKELLVHGWRILREMSSHNQRSIFQVYK